MPSQGNNSTSFAIQLNLVASPSNLPLPSTWIAIHSSRLGSVLLPIFFADATVCGRIDVRRWMYERHVPFDQMKLSIAPDRTCEIEKPCSKTLVVTRNTGISKYKKRTRTTKNRYHEVSLIDDIISLKNKYYFEHTCLGKCTHKWSPQENTSYNNVNRPKFNEIGKELQTR